MYSVFSRQLLELLLRLPGMDVTFATSAEIAFDARAACASLIACCATAVALSRIDCGSEGFELTSVSNERAVCRRTTAEAKDIQFGNDAYKAFPKVYHVFLLLTSHALLLFPARNLPSEPVPSSLPKAGTKQTTEC